MKLYYVAHPVGSDTTQGIRDNLERAQRWFRWLVQSFPDAAFTMPWLPYCLVLEETEANRERGIRDDLEALRRCDGIVLCGGRISSGMQQEIDVALELGLEYKSVLHLGVDPPKWPAPFRREP